MIISYRIDPIILPKRKKGQSYKDYNNILLCFFKTYLETYDYREHNNFNVWKSFKEDFQEDPSYEYLVKLIYKQKWDCKCS